MADYNLGTAHGRIVIDVDDKGSAKAAKSMNDLDKESKEASDRLEAFAQYCDRVEDRLQAVTNRLESIDFTPIDNLSRANQRGAMSADEHRNRMVQLTASIGEMGAVALGAGAQGQNKLRQAGVGLVQTFAEVGANVDKTSFKMELLQYTMNGLDKTIGRVSRGIDAINTPLRDLDRAGIKAYLAIDRVTNRFSAFAAAGHLVGAVATGVVASGLSTITPVAVGLGGALATMTGVALTIPAIFLSAGLAAATLKVATSGMGDAMKAAASGDIKAMNEAIKDMPPQMKEVATATAKLAPMFKALRLDVQSQFWSEIGGRVEKVGKQYLPMVGTAMGRVAASFNSGMHDVIDFYMEARNIAEVNGIFNNSAIAVDNITRRFRPLVQIFHTLTAVGSEFLPMLSEGLGRGIDRMAAFVSSAEGITKIRGWIAGGIEAFGDFWTITKNVGKTIGQIFTIANANGAGFFDRLVILTTQMLAFTKSADGVKAIGGIFQLIQATGDAVTPVILALAKVIGVQLAPGLAQLIQMIGPKLVPFVEALGDAIARLMSATPELADIFNQLLDAITPLLPVIGQTLGDNIKFFQNAVSILLPPLKLLIDLFTALPVPVQSFLLSFAVLTPVIAKVVFSITKFMTILTLMATLTGKSSLAMRLLGIAPAQAGKRFVFLRRVIATLFSPLGKIISLGARLAKIKWLTTGLSKLAGFAGPLGKVASAFTRFSGIGRVLLGISRVATIMLQAFKIASILKFFGALITWPKRAAMAFLTATKRVIVASAQWVAAMARTAAASVASAARSFAAWVAAGARAAGAWVVMAARATAAFVMTAARATASAIASAAAWVAAGVRAAGAWLAMQARALATFLMVQLRAAAAAIMTAASWVAAGVRSAGAWLAMQARALATFAMIAIRAGVSAIATSAAWVAAGVRSAGAWIAMQVRALATFTVIAARAVASAVASSAAWVAAGARAAGAWIIMQARAIASFAVTAASATAGAATASAAWLVAQARMAAGWVAMQVRALVSMAITVAGVVAGWVVMGTQALIQAARMAAAWLIALGPVGIVIAIVIALVALIIMNWDRIKAWTIAAFTAVWTFLVSVWNNIKTWVMSAIMYVYTIIMTYLTMVQAFWSMVWNAIVTVVTTIWNTIKTWVQTAILFVYTVIMTYLNMVRAFWTMVWNAIVTVATTVWNAIRTAVQVGITFVQNIITTVLNAIRSFFVMIWNAISNAVSTAVNTIRSIVTSVFNAVRNFITTCWTAAQTLTIAAWNAMKSAVSAGVQAVVGFVSGLVDRIKGFFSNAKDWLINAGRAIMDGLLAGIKAAWEAVAGFLGGLANKIKSLKGPEKKDAKLLIPEGKAIIGGLQEGMMAKTSPMLKWVGDLAGRVSGMVNGASIADKMKNLGQDVISKLAQGLRTSEDKVRNAITRVREALQGIGNVDIGTVIDRVKSVAAKAGLDLSPYLGAVAGASSPETRAASYGKPPAPAAAASSSQGPRAGDTYNLYTTVPQGSTVKELSETITFDLRHAGKGVYR